MPPGDVVCPFCNALVWSAKRAGRRESYAEYVQLQIQLLSYHARNAISIEHFEPLLLRSLTDCLAAHSASIWVADWVHGFFSSEMKLRVEETLWEDYVGLPETLDLAKRTFHARDGMVQSIEYEGRPYTVLTAPVFKNGQVTRIIEVVQRSQYDTAILRGYLGFMKQMAEIFASNPQLSA